MLQQQTCQVGFTPQTQLGDIWSSADSGSTWQLVVAEGGWLDGWVDGWMDGWMASADFGGPHLQVPETPIPTPETPGCPRIFKF